MSILINKIEQSLSLNPINAKFIGYMIDNFGYRLWDYENHKIFRSRNVVLNENVMYKYSFAWKEIGKGKHKVHSA